MAKQVKTVIKLQIEAGKANPAPPIGPALGQHGVAIMEFCKAYNDQTRDRMGTVIPAEITIYVDRTFSFVLKTSPTSQLIKKAASLDKGSAKPNRDKVGKKLTREDLIPIAQEKMPDLNTNDLEAALKIIAGSARSMGVEVQL